MCTCANIRAKATVRKLLFMEHNASYYQYCGYSFLFWDNPYQFMLIGFFKECHPRCACRNYISGSLVNNTTSWNEECMF
jgi:hypothetical protein